MKILVRRIVAEFIDLALCWAIALLIEWIFPIQANVLLFGGEIKEALWMFLVAVIYEGICDSITGQTFGKYMMYIMVKKEDDMDLSLTRSFLRSLIKNASIFFLYGIASVFSVLYMTQNLHGSFHDRICETGVWKKKRST